MNNALLLTVILAYGTLVLELAVFPIPSEASALSLWNRPRTLRERLPTAVAALPALLLYLTPVGATVSEVAGAAAVFRPVNSVSAQTGMVLVWIGSMLHLTATLVFRRKTAALGGAHQGNAATLVESGPFSVSRNPIALGLMLCAFGWGLLIGPTQVWNAVAMLAALYTVLYLDRKVRIEERAVLEKLGPAYALYTLRVARYLGRRRASRSR